ncbi:MAG: DUF1491 family protein [Sphingorhabdus sp.]
MPPEPRLATHMRVSAMIRQVSALGDFAAVLHKGDPIAGVLLLVTRVKGRNPALFEQFPSPNGSQNWQRVFDQDVDNEQKISEYLDRRIAQDSDLWVLELDVAFDERLDGLLARQG